MSQSPTLTLEPSPELVELIAHRAAELVEPPGPEPYLNKAAMADRL